MRTAAGPFGWATVAGDGGRYTETIRGHACGLLFLRTQPGVAVLLGRSVLRPYSGCHWEPARVGGSARSGAGWGWEGQAGVPVPLCWRRAGQVLLH